MISVLFSGMLMFAGVQATAQVVKKVSTPASGPKAVSQLPASPQQLALQSLTSTQKLQMQSMIANHNQVRGQLSLPDRTVLDQLIPRVSQELFSIPLRGNLLGLTTQIVNRMAPGLNTREAESIAWYSLGGIAAAIQGGDQTGVLQSTKQMPETQMSFNLQYLQLQSQMQHENRSYSAISNIMKTKHDTVKNSISNIR